MRLLLKFWLRWMCSLANGHTGSIHVTSNGSLSNISMHLQEKEPFIRKHLLDTSHPRATLFDPNNRLLL